MSLSVLHPSERSSVVDRGARTPLYHQIYLILRDQILDSSFAADAVLPSEQELMRQYGVSRITAKRALNELAAEGLVVRGRGRGTRVSGTPTPPMRASIEGLLENLIVMGLETEVTLLDFAYGPATPEVAEALECGPGDIVQRALRIRLVEGAPFSYLVTYVPEAIGRTYTRRDLASTPLLTLLERSGAEVTRADQVISARLADAQVAAHLGVEVGSALIKITRIVRDQHGRPMEYIIALYRPDRYQYGMSLSRVQERSITLWSVDTLHAKKTAAPHRPARPRRRAR